MTQLGSFQQTVARALTALAIIHVPIFAAIAYALGGDTWSIAMLTLVLAAAPIIALALQRPLKIVAFALVIALVGQTSLLVYVFSGHPWQVEMHFYYFAVLAMLSGFCEWCVLVTAAGLIAVHHLKPELRFALGDLSGRQQRRARCSARRDGGGRDGHAGPHRSCHPLGVRAGR